MPRHSKPHPLARVTALGSGLGPSFSSPQMEILVSADLKRRGIDRPTIEDMRESARRIVQELSDKPID